MLNTDAVVIIKKLLNNTGDDDDHDDEDRMACQNHWSKMVRPQRGSKDSCK